jgi:hypothetical protein
MYLFKFHIVDRAENSVERCKERYNLRKRNCGYDADFYALDCTKVCL